jgi:uncharacterized protein (UPF0218 family)
MDFDSNYILPKKSRKELSKPAGELLEGTIKQNIKIAHNWLKEHYAGSGENYHVICIGDVVSEAFLKDPELSSHLKMCIVDGKTKRDVYNIQPGDILPNHVKLENPPGMISGPALKRLKEIMNSDRKYFIEIEGEEDLLVIPIVILAENNTFVIYGQPPITDLGGTIPAGMVVISVNSKFKELMKNILNSFEKEKL